MKRLAITISLFLTTLVLSAIPAKRGQWQTLTLADGTEVRAQLVGDEHLHFWQSEDGQRFTIQPDGKAVKADMEQMRAKAMSRRAGKTLANRLRSPRRVNIGDRTHYTGQKKGIVILMQFTKTKFKAANNQEKYNDLLNKENYQEGSFKGSVADYFKAQSNGQFELNFDVVGPYTANNDYSYYGENDENGNDMRPELLIMEAVKAADKDVDFNDYDWDGDGTVDQVFVVYAGRGEASSYDDKTIWPHMWWLSKTNSQLTLDGVLIDTYACSNELTSAGTLDGIGCFCHEFSHCLGYPDLYDVSYQGWFGMSQFDLMDQGSYNDNSFRPAGYSAYEKWMAGWLEPTVLATDNDTITALAPISENGPAYIMYNDAYPDEFYMIENRQKTKWDTALPGKGLMITHVDFDKDIWEQNTPNSKVTKADVRDSGGELTKTNDHQRCTLIHADNQDDHDYWNSYALTYTWTTLTTDLYPYSNNDSLTATSSPAATLYNKNSLGQKYMQGAIINIKQNTNKTINFIYRAKKDEQPADTTHTTPVDPLKPVVAHGDTLFYESFNKCDGTGANDGKWGTNIAGSSSKFATDNDGWDYIAAYAGYQCARFGNATKLGEATTPPFTIDGEATLTFRATTWNTDGDQLALTVTQVGNTDDDTEAAIPDASASGRPASTVTIEPKQLTMDSFAWKDFTVTLSGKGIVKLTFTPEKRFLLDEVLVVKPSDNDSTTVLRGDVNLDGIVDVADIAAIIDAMAAATPASAPAASAPAPAASVPEATIPGASAPGPLTAPAASAQGNPDVNQDGIVDVADIAAVIDIMAGKEEEQQ